ncbi:MAG: DUF1207 domain-containing protein [Pseudomonadota bacterium]|nr:DUF1207 domain-containing protein [Pseudomonadota bacterium]
MDTRTLRSISRAGSALLLLGACQHATAAMDGDSPIDFQTGWIPSEQIFEPIAAGNAEALNYVSFVHLDPDGEGQEPFTAALVSLGESFPIYRWKTSGGSYWQFDLFGNVQSQFDMDAESDALLNTDFFIGFPLAWRKDDWSARLRLFHQSSHLGDELVLSDDAPERINLTYEAADVLLAYQFNGWRLYGGGTYLFSKDSEFLGDYSVRGGAEYLSPERKLLGGRFIAGLDLLGADFFNNDIQTKAIAGVRWGRDDPDAGTITLALQAFTGPTPFGQFFDYTSTFYGLIAYFTLD